MLLVPHLYFGQSAFLPLAALTGHCQVSEFYPVSTLEIGSIVRVCHFILWTPPALLQVWVFFLLCWRAFPLCKYTLLSACLLHFIKDPISMFYVHYRWYGLFTSLWRSTKLSLHSGQTKTFEDIILGFRKHWSIIIWIFFAIFWHFRRPKSQSINWKTKLTDENNH